MANPDFYTLFQAQLVTAQEQIQEEIDWHAGDDQWDYLRASLQLTLAMMDIMETEDDNARLLIKLRELRPTKNYACDGVARLIWEWVEGI